MLFVYRTDSDALAALGALALSPSPAHASS
jgi:hypothetical protein